MTCRVCGQEKRADEFPRNRRRCKECAKEYNRQWFKDHPELTKKYERKTREKNRQAIKARITKYMKTERGKASVRKAVEKWKKNNPEKCRAQNLIYKAVKRGAIERPSACSQCGKESKIEAHHKDYNLPYVVEWLCRECHRAISTADGR